MLFLKGLRIWYRWIAFICVVSLIIFVYKHQTLNDDYIYLIVYHAVPLVLSILIHTRLSVLIEFNSKSVHNVMDAANYLCGGKRKFIVSLR